MDNDSTQRGVALHIVLSGEFDEDDIEGTVRAIGFVLQRIPIEVRNTRTIGEEVVTDSSTVDEFLRSLDNGPTK
jgi:hypothetical protein